MGELLHHSPNNSPQKKKKKKGEKERLGKYCFVGFFLAEA